MSLNEIVRELYFGSGKVTFDDGSIAQKMQWPRGQVVMFAFGDHSRTIVFNQQQLEEELEGRSLCEPQRKTSL